MFIFAHQSVQMNKKPVRKFLYYALHAIGFILLYLVLRNFNWASFKELFSSFSVFQFLIGLGILLTVYMIKSLRWFFINRIFDIKISYGNTLVFFLASGFLSVITPGRIGEFSKIFFLTRKTGVSNLKATSSVILDRVWDVLVLSLLGGVGILFVFGGFQINIWTLVFIILFFCLALAIIIFPVIIFKPVIHFSRKNKQLQNELEEVYHTWKSNVKKLLLPGFLSTLLAFLILAMIPLVFTGSLGQEVGIIHSISAVSISNILAFLPVTVAGFGTRELVFTEIWKVMNYSPESAITISTAYFISNYLGSMLLGGFVYLIWFRKHFRYKDITKVKSL